jgi:ABC-type phosphate transport system substrate-binding protein
MLFTSNGITRDRRPLFMPLARFRLTHLIAVLLIVALQLPKTASGILAADYQGTLRISGTGAALGTMAQVTAGFQKQYPGVRVVIPPSLGSTGGIKAVIAGALDLGLSSRPLTEAEARQGLVAFEYARSPFLLVTSHKDAGVNFTGLLPESVWGGVY